MNEYLKIGQIVTTHGVKGEIKVFPLTDNIKRFTKLKFAFMKNNDSFNKIEIESVKYLKNMVILKLSNINDMNAAALLRDEYLYIDRENAIKLPKDSYFICDLIGISVYSTDNEYLGKIKDVLTIPCNDVYEVVQDNGKTFLVPVVADIVKEIDIENKRITINLLEGLI